MSADTVQFTEELRNQIRQELVDGAGKVSRRDIARRYNVRYQTIYGFTNDIQLPRQPAFGGNKGGQQPRVMVELENGQTIGRAEYIRGRIKAGASRQEVAEELGVDYQIVYAALKGKRAQEAGLTAAGGRASAPVHPITSTAVGTRRVAASEVAANTTNGTHAELEEGLDEEEFEVEEGTEEEEDDELNPQL
jgi:transposase-like protein